MPANTGTPADVPPTTLNVTFCASRNPFPVHAISRHTGQVTVVIDRRRKRDIRHKSRVIAGNAYPGLPGRLGEQSALTSTSRGKLVVSVNSRCQKACRSRQFLECNSSLILGGGVGGVPVRAGTFIERRPADRCYIGEAGRNIDCQPVCRAEDNLVRVKG